MVVPLQGTIHGKTVELEVSPGLADGQKVEVVIRALPAEPAWGEGIRRSAGALGMLPEDEMILNQLHEERQRSSRPEVEP